MQSRARGPARLDGGRGLVGRDAALRAAPATRPQRPRTAACRRVLAAVSAASRMRKRPRPCRARAAACRAVAARPCLRARAACRAPRPRTAAWIVAVRALRCSAIQADTAAKAAPRLAPTVALASRIAVLRHV